MVDKKRFSEAETNFTKAIYYQEELANDFSQHPSFKNDLLLAIIGSELSFIFRGNNFFAEKHLKQAQNIWKI